MALPRGAQRHTDRPRYFVMFRRTWPGDFRTVPEAKKFYDDAVDLLRGMILGQVAPNKLKLSNSMLRLDQVDDLSASEDMPATPSNLESEELRSVIAIIRHGDRTPKQKMKVRMQDAAMLELLRLHGNARKGCAKLKQPAQLQAVLDVVNSLLNAGKVAWEDDSLEPEKLREKQREILKQLMLVRRVLSQKKAGGSNDKCIFSGINRKVQLKAERRAEDGSVLEVLLIVKHGGVMTRAGRQQAEELGHSFRQSMYISSGEKQTGQEASGLLRLHSTFRHDLKIYSSEEGRVQMSAAAFAKALLDLEGTSLAPILVSLVEKDSSMLEAYGKGADADIKLAKEHINEYMTGVETTATDKERRTSEASANSEEERSCLETEEPLEMLSALRKQMDVRLPLPFSIGHRGSASP